MNKKTFKTGRVIKTIKSDKDIEVAVTELIKRYERAKIKQDRTRNSNNSAGD